MFSVRSVKEREIETENVCERERLWFFSDGYFSHILKAEKLKKNNEFITLSTPSSRPVLHFDFGTGNSDGNNSISFSTNKMDYHSIVFQLQDGEKIMHTTL
jgi:hypothetical protein